MPRRDSPPVNIAHRGHALTLENTLESFHESIDMGAAMLELDVRLSKDGVPIVFHDNSLTRITGRKSGTISSRTSTFLTQLDLGAGKRISRLDDALRELIPRIPVNIELKFPHMEYRPLVFAVLDAIERNQAQENVLVSSFFHQALEILHRSDPHVATAPLFGKITGKPHDDDLARLSRSRKKWLNSLPFENPAAVVAWTMVDEELVRRFRKSKLTLLIYTVDEPEYMKRLADLGVDGIITNRPDLLDQVLYHHKS
jgi:glycerophosphoryl diester phosphodiesterase